jgi:ArsR family transcriptional regulator
MSLADGEFYRIAKAFSDRRRFEILEFISRTGEVSCKDIVRKFRVAQPTVSHHLKILADAELLSVRRVRQFGYYSANRARVSVTWSGSERRSVATKKE